MRFIIVGAGAVGALVGAQLARAGHEVSFWVRPAQRRAHARLVIEPVEHGRGTSGGDYELVTRFLGSGDTPPAHDWVFVCVRGEQLDDALQEVASQLGAESNVIISTVSFESVLRRARRHGLRGHVLAHLVAFGVHRDADDPERFLWFPFAAPSLITPDGEASAMVHARELARLLTLAGLSSKPVRSARDYTLAMMSLSAPFLAAWDECNFELERLSRDSQLRALTARAMVEAPRALSVGGVFRVLRLLPAPLWSCVLRVLPRFIGANGREVWRHHGPKIREQTRYCLELLLAASTPLPAVRAIADRFAQRHPLEESASAARAHAPSPSLN